MKPAPVFWTDPTTLSWERVIFMRGLAAAVRWSETEEAGQTADLLDDALDLLCDVLMARGDPAPSCEYPTTREQSTAYRAQWWAKRAEASDETDA